MHNHSKPNGNHKNVDSSPAIPPASGSCSVSHARNRRFKTAYAALLALATATFYFDTNNRFQHASMALMFPGGGFVGLGGFWLIGFVVNFLLFCISLVLWFATGNIVAPFMTWFGQALIISILPQANRPRMAYSHFVVTALVLISYRVITRHMGSLRQQQILRREERNIYLPSVLAEAKATKAAALETNDDDREIREEDLKYLRWQIELGMLADDDWSQFDVIEQFQPAALRYQINEAGYTLAFANRWYTPSFRGSYLQQAQKKLIYKYCQEKVLGYWKWECLWGKLTTNYEPVLKDNIMLTGFFLLSLEFYRAATLDETFTKDGALVLEIDKNHRYPHSAKTLAKALLDNWSQSGYCLYPCEPNWIYTFCNLYAINALKCFDTNEGTDHVSGVIDRFRKGYIEEFTDLDGTCVPIKSSITGFVIPGLIGIVNELACSAMTASPMPDVSERAYAVAKKEVLTVDKQGKLADINCLQGADKVDPGRYQKSTATFYAAALTAAQTSGDKPVVKALERLIMEDMSLGPKEEAGVFTYDNVSVSVRSSLLRAKLMFQDGWKRMLEEPMPDILRNGPLLADAKYPEVLVAKARSHTGSDLELVLYPGTEKNSVLLGLAQLNPGAEYKVNETATFKADSHGKATITVTLDKRTPLWVKPQ